MSNADDTQRVEPLFDPPPLPGNVSPDVAYLGQLQLWSTRELLRDGQRTRDALVREEAQGGGVARAFQAFGKLPVGVQVGVASTLSLLLMQLAGALFEHYTGHPPPQTTVPVQVQDPAPELGKG